jgi:hypothetical protein
MKTTRYGASLVPALAATAVALAALATVTSSWIAGEDASPAQAAAKVLPAAPERQP